METEIVTVGENIDNGCGQNGDEDGGCGRNDDRDRDSGCRNRDRDCERWTKTDTVKMNIDEHRDSE